MYVLQNMYAGQKTALSFSCHLPSCWGRVSLVSAASDSWPLNFWGFCFHLLSCHRNMGLQMCDCCIWASPRFWRSFNSPLLLGRSFIYSYCPRPELDIFAGVLTFLTLKYAVCMNVWLIPVIWTSLSFYNLDIQVFPMIHQAVPNKHKCSSNLVIFAFINSQWNKSVNWNWKLLNFNAKLRLNLLFKLKHARRRKLWKTKHCPPNTVSDSLC